MSKIRPLVVLTAAVPRLAILPGLAITLTVAAVNLFGDGLNDWRERPHK